LILLLRETDIEVKDNSKKKCLWRKMYSIEQSRCLDMQQEMWLRFNDFFPRLLERKKTGTDKPEEE
jgi:ABC-type Fe3+-citrate transport system substrate-binding protein